MSTRDSTRDHVWIARNVLGLSKCSVCGASRVVRSDGGVYFVVGGIRQPESPPCFALSSLSTGGAS